MAKWLLFAFFLTTVTPPGGITVLAQELSLPAPGQMVALSPAYSPVVLKGIQLDPQNPLRFHFFVDTGDKKMGTGSNSALRPQRGQELVPVPIFSKEQLKTESSKLIKYFLASLTIPEQDLWVNLSPYEKNRIVPQEFGQTQMGRDLLAEDYILKQITASLIYPESKLGKEFWQKVYSQVQAKYGTTSIPVNTFNKVWIVPDKAVVYENNGTAFVLENHLKVMLEEDYISLSKHQGQPGDMSRRDVSPSGLPSKRTLNVKATSELLRKIILPALEHEVNEGKNFSQLRQVFYSLILATWYKKKIKDSILNRVYSNRKKTNGLDIADSSYVIPASSSVIPAQAGIQNIEYIYRQYLQAFKKGVFNYINEEPSATGQTIPRKYFSGGFTAMKLNEAMTTVGPLTADPAEISELIKSNLESHLINAAVFLKFDASASTTNGSAQVFKEIRALVDSIEDEAYHAAWEIIDAPRQRPVNEMLDFALPLPFGEPDIYKKGTCRYVIPQFYRRLKGQDAYIVKADLTALNDDANPWKIQEHDFILLFLHGEIFVIDPTYQQLVAGSNRDHGLPKVMVEKLSDLDGLLRGLGVIGGAAIWFKGLKQNPALLQKIRSIQGYANLDVTKAPHDSAMNFRKGPGQGGNRQNIEGISTSIIQQLPGYVPALTDLYERYLMLQAGVNTELGLSETQQKLVRAWIKDVLVLTASIFKDRKLIVKFDFWERPGFAILPVAAGELWEQLDETKKEKLQDLTAAIAKKEMLDDAKGQFDFDLEDHYRDRSYIKKASDLVGRPVNWSRVQGFYLMSPEDIRRHNKLVEQINRAADSLAAYMDLTVHSAEPRISLKETPWEYTRPVTDPGDEEGIPVRRMFRWQLAKVEGISLYSIDLFMTDEDSLRENKPPVSIFSFALYEEQKINELLGIFERAHVIQSFIDLYQQENMTLQAFSANKDHLVTNLLRQACIFAGSDMAMSHAHSKAMLTIAGLPRAEAIELVDPRHQAEVADSFNAKGIKKSGKTEFMIGYAAKFPTLTDRIANYISKEVPLNARILSIGEGQGFLAGHLKSMGFNVSAVDISPKATAIAVKRGVDQRVGDASRLSAGFHDEEFDLVIFNESIGTMLLEAPLREAYRVLKQNGKIMITTYPSREIGDREILSRVTHYLYYSPEEIKAGLSNAGFDSILEGYLPTQDIPKTGRKVGRETLLEIFVSHKSIVQERTVRDEDIRYRQSVLTAQAAGWRRLSSRSDLNWEKAAVVPWGEIVRDPGAKPFHLDKAPNNDKRYHLNQLDVRQEVLQLLARLARSEDLSLDDFSQWLLNTHRIELMGRNKDTPYVSETQGMRWKVRDVARYAGRFRDSHLVTRDRLNGILGGLKFCLNSTGDAFFMNLAYFYRYFMGGGQVGDFLFPYGNNSLAFNFINALLRLKGYEHGISHDNLDQYRLIPTLKEKLMEMTALTKGGIDLNPAQMSMEVKAESPTNTFGDDGSVSINPAQITGVSFTIEKMTSVTNLTAILGLNKAG